MSGAACSVPACAHTGPQGCGDGAEAAASTTTTAVTPTDEWLEQEVAAGFRVWQIIFMAIAGVLACVVMLCCCIRFRIPRTKQEIEADYVRKKLTREFQKKLHIIHNTEMDNMDLRRALERVQAECRSESDSPASCSSGRSPPPPPSEGLGRRHRSVDTGASGSDYPQQNS
ncbi:uncharacterized protein LOC126326178 [Schistocerca gregaria]|uniref:uncharacterized protein LOC126326178 n=1 Tax=Schistocerca gregaria TaxID=7010 RepID=UPI00211DFD0C|nr:uncharacterized protein LOC126326178 [Schistocerca gregaria]